MRSTCWVPNQSEWKDHSEKKGGTIKQATGMMGEEKTMIIREFAVECSMGPMIVGQEN